LQEEIEKSLFEKRKEKDKNETISLIHLDPTLHLFKKRKLFNFLQDKFVYKGIIDTKVKYSIILFFIFLFFYLFVFSLL